MKYYCIGIKGTGMSTLAQILFDLGNEVSGYDDAKEYKFTQKGLESRDINIYYGNDHDIDKDTIVTYSVAFSPLHKEIVRVKNMGLEIKKYSEIVGDVVDMFDTVSIAGTHGKTTTSSIVRHILENTLGCNYFVGAGDGYATKENKYFVIESDEFNKHFLHYHPKYSIITNIEEEHMECYKDLDDIINSFSQFASQTKDLVIACGDNLNVLNINSDTKTLFYGFNETNDIVIKNVNLTSTGSEFDIYITSEFFGHFNVPLFGTHMVLNATSAIVMCNKIGIETQKIHDLLLTFKNAERRFAESMVGDTVIIDDYAHHPTEIKVTLDAVRQKYPNRRIVVVFKPNTYSRTRDFTKDFIESLNAADRAYVTEIDSNREKASDYPGISSHIIIDELRDGFILDEDDVSKLRDEKGNVVCFMSCAYVNHLIDNFKEVIK